MVRSKYQPAPWRSFGFAQDDKVVCMILSTQSTAILSTQSTAILSTQSL